MSFQYLQCSKTQNVCYNGAKLKKGEITDLKKILSLFVAMFLAISVLIATPINSVAATSTSSAGIVKVSSGSLNVRTSASTSSAVLTSLPKGSYVTLMSQSGSWWRVEYTSGKYGYCSSSYIEKVSSSTAAEVKTDGTVLNVRKGAGTSHGVQATLKNNTVIVVLSQSGSWYRVLYSGTRTGYVSTSYVKKYSSSTPATYPAIKLSVPDFKQTDSRWGSHKIGTTGGTIRTIGCATTALSMMESFRTKTTITPPTMVSKLTYTAGGSVYWPSNYTFTFTNNYNDIYNSLKAGKPVLFGSKNAAGGQHWVVITGFSGGNTLTASAFTINDPGTGARTNLQHLLSAYPNFYKYAVYK